MAHLLSFAFFLSILVGLAMFLESMFRDSAPAIRAALLGTWAADRSTGSILQRIGTCLRASFPSAGQEALSDDLSRLVLQLSTRTTPRR